MNQYAVSSFGNWELKKCLGAGGFGEVLLWKHRNNNQEIATKRLKENNRFSEDEVVKIKQRWLQEYEWMRHLNTAYIVRSVNLEDEAFLAYLNERHAWHPLPVIIMEYCNAGDLRTQLDRVENLNGLHEFEVREALRALRHAVEYLHTQCHLEHRDLKPDNIVIHQEGSRRTYKLTDFGFARKITENSMLKSVVGTRNYFAPEVVDTAMYTNTVDYWSVGVIAFELMCGLRPFIPHQELYHIIVNIKKKSDECIAITEQPDADRHFIQQTQMFTENRMSTIFLKKMEKWLRLALDSNYKTRGTEPQGSGRVLTFYSELDSILDSKILTIFCLTTCKFHSFEIRTESSDDIFFKSDLLDVITRDTGLLKEQLFLVLPTLHPLGSINSKTTVGELFVTNWQDTSNELNPPVMLYVLGFQCEYSLPQPRISELLKTCIGWNQEKPVPKWLLPLFELHVHFLLSHEQRTADTLIAGLREYILTVENEVFHFDTSVLLNEILLVSGIVRQFRTMVQCASAEVEAETKLENRSTFFNNWTIKSEDFSKEVRKLEANVGSSIKKRHSSVLRRIREEVANKFYEEPQLKDLYSLKEFRVYLKNVRANSDLRSRHENCKKAIYNCLEKRHKFYADTQFVKARNTIAELHLEFRKIQEIFRNTRQYLMQFEANVSRETATFFKELYSKCSRCSPVRQKPLLDSLPLSLSDVNRNDLSNSLHQLLELNTANLIQDAMHNLQLIDDEMKEVSA